HGLGRHRHASLHTPASSTHECVRVPESKKTQSHLMQSTVLPRTVPLPSYLIPLPRSVMPGSSNSVSVPLSPRVFPSPSKGPSATPSPQCSIPRVLFPRAPPSIKRLNCRLLTFLPQSSELLQAGDRAVRPQYQLVRLDR